jgi:hypothetical protein
MRALQRLGIPRRGRDRTRGIGLGLRIFCGSGAFWADACGKAAATQTAISQRCKLARNGLIVDISVMLEEGAGVKKMTEVSLL